MGKKNVKVSEIVYDKLEAKKRSGETFDDTLRRIMGIYPNLDNLMAYLDEEDRENGRKIIEFIETLGNFEKEVKKNYPSNSEDSIIFKDKEEKIEIASVDIGEDWFKVRYRNKDGDMKSLLRSYNINSEKDFEYEKERIESKITGAVRKWGSTEK